MSSFTRTLATLAVLALPVAAAHADTFTGSASFSDNGPVLNGLNYTGTFATPDFSFSGGVGTTFTDLLTITATQVNVLPTSDSINVKVTFTVPGSVTDNIGGTGSNSYSFFGLFKDNTINWSNNLTYINFMNGAQLSASLPDFTFSSLSASPLAQGAENLTLTVTKTAVTPEPSSLALLGTGLVSACGVIRRRLAR